MPKSRELAQANLENIYRIFTVPEAPDFVVQTRRPVQDFIPVHTPRAKPDGKPRTPTSDS